MNKVRLSTKLLTPTIGQGFVLRPRLIERLDAGVTGRLTLIAAPAGYGKTILVAHWIYQRDLKVAWVSLDPGDNDPQCFWTYLIAALENVAPDGFGYIIDMLHPSRRSSREDRADLDTIIAELINALTTLRRTIILVLDDYHHIENHIIHETLSSFLRALPPNVRLVIASRGVPPLPLGWLRVSRQVLELNATDLRFSRAEVEALCNGLMGLSLAEEDLDILEARTEGWPAGLQLAALSLQYAERPTSAVHAFSGGNRFVFDYLVEEVLKTQPEKTQRFLMQTSILTQLNAAVCAAVTGMEDAQAMLEGLDSARLFIEPLDQNRGWYRYHALFADSLRELLQRTADRETISALFKRASLWFERQGSIEEAVSYALAAGDFSRAATFLESLSLQMFQKNMLHTLIGWLKMLPDEVLDSNPSLRLYYAMALTATWQAGKAEAYLRKIEHSLSVTAEDLTDEEMRALTPEARSLYANATVMRCLLSMKTMDTSRAIRIAEHTLAHM
ncbi:MAG TPA: hypothetical protein PLB81_10770, partial [Deltaproteobacteria bacterium]|nr:hypothetical protein [Deltaproteobacteria bacterium]